MNGFRSQVARVARKDLGQEAEARVAVELKKHGIVQIGVLGVSGENGEPDLLLRTSLAGYAVEVKSMLPYHRRAQTATRKASSNPGRINLDPEAWERMATWARMSGWTPALVVEVRIRGYPNLYHWLSEKKVDQWISRSSEAKMVHISLYDLPLLAKYSWRPGVMEELNHDTL